MHFFPSDYWSRARGLSTNKSNVIDFYHKKEIEGGGGVTVIFGKSDDSQNTVKFENVYFLSMLYQRVVSICL